MLQAVTFKFPDQYEGRSDKKRDGFVFKDSLYKSEAVLGILCIR